MYAVIQWCAPSVDHETCGKFARGFCVVLLALILLGLCLRNSDVWHDSAMMFLTMILLSTTIHPWYLLWAFVFIPIVRSRALWVASLTLPWGYIAWADPDGWSAPVRVTIAAHVPIYIALVFDLTSRKITARD